MTNALSAKDSEISTLQEKLRARETTITELTSYVKHLKRHVTENDTKVSEMGLTSLVAPPQVTAAATDEANSPRHKSSMTVGATVKDDDDESCSGEDGGTPSLLQFYGGYVNIHRTDKAKAQESKIIKDL